MKEDELQSILNYLLTMHEVNACLRLEVGRGGRAKRGGEGDAGRVRVEPPGEKMCIIICGLELWST